MCKECYVNKNRITPLLNPLDCLEKHTQYICGTCGRYICIERDPHRGLQRWNFPFKSLEIANLYLRVADYTLKNHVVYMKWRILKVEFLIRFSQEMMICSYS